ncbi:MAG: helix-turn-helix domain-containing protein [Bdellovibrionales bacterium]
MSRKKGESISGYLTVGEAAQLLGVSGTTLRNWDRKGKLRPRRNPMNKYRLYEKAQVLSILEKIRRSDR